MSIVENPVAASVDIFAPTRPAARPGLLDVRRFHDPMVFRAEMEKLWAKVWQIGCLVSEIPRPGDYHEYVVGDWSFLIVREGPDSIKAYHNVCHHRGRKVKTGSGNASRLTCMYHGWTWKLSGEIDEIPERDSFCPFADDEVALTAVSVGVFKDFVFINPDPEAEPLEKYLGGMGDIIEAYRYERMYRWRSMSTVLRGNWKNVVDAFTENYHARTVHPESTPFIDYTNPVVVLVDDHSLNVSPFGLPDSLTYGEPPDMEDALDAMEWALRAFGEDTTAVGVLREMKDLKPGPELRETLLGLMKAGYQQGGMDMTGLTDSQLVDNWHFHVFPNVLVNQYSFGYWLFRVRPIDTEYSAFDMWYAHRVPDGADLPAPAETEFIPDGQPCGPVMDQDFSNIPHQQLGQKSPALKGLRYSSIEARCMHMHDVIDRYLNA
jgi:phenylpropionate dioxygenase-like ring-hydroxylating dioxygenase large terminal subunit